MNEIYLKVASMNDKSNIKEFYDEYHENKREIYKSLDNSICFDKWIDSILQEPLSSNEKMFLLYRKLDSKLIGISIIRLNPNEFLYKYWGNIGYYIRLDEHRRGYGKQLFKLTLEECKRLRLNHVAVVCYKKNIASVKIIQENKAVFEDEILDEDGKEPILRFLIELK